MEYSGPKLALFKYAQWSKLIIFSTLFVALFIPWGAGLFVPFAWLVFWAKVLGSSAAGDGCGRHACALSH